MSPQHDVLIVGAGPAGLCLARAPADSGLDVLIVEPQQSEALAAPAFDGREIALTQHSVRLLQALELWQRMPEEQRFPLRAARILDGEDPRGIEINPLPRGPE